jgi:hypothetical protein
MHYASSSASAFRSFTNSLILSTYVAGLPQQDPVKPGTQERERRVTVSIISLNGYCPASLVEFRRATHYSNSSVLEAQLQIGHEEASESDGTGCGYRR